MLSSPHCTGHTLCIQQCQYLMLNYHFSAFCVITVNSNFIYSLFAIWFFCFSLFCVIKKWKRNYFCTKLCRDDQSITAWPFNLNLYNRTGSIQSFLWSKDSQMCSITSCVCLWFTSQEFTFGVCHFYVRRNMKW